jgi:hypothetical protein
MLQAAARSLPEWVNYQAHNSRVAALPPNIKPSVKALSRANNCLAYLASSSVTKKKKY